MSVRDYSPELGLHDDDFVVEISDVEDENVEENREEEEVEVPAKKPKLSADRKIAASSNGANQDQAPPSARTRAASTRPPKQQTAPKRRQARSGRPANIQSAPQSGARSIDWTHNRNVERVSSLPPVRSNKEDSIGPKCRRRSVSPTKSEVTDERLCFLREYMALKALTKKEMEEFDNEGFMPPHRKICTHPVVVGAAEAKKEYATTGKKAEILGELFHHIYPQYTPFYQHIDVRCFSAFKNVLRMMAELRLTSKKQTLLKALKDEKEKELAALKVDEEINEEAMETAWRQF
ncbi:hypothetical protein GCK72_023110 [Caenorhabditis remanei]|uniref:Uncharacterized protein n=1 Tax=Caenorhabditis remanei TaxID=31234 RepID=A0A6A5FVS8_CAERE|nr:hypothetical protein GCK72_023110 [Caenorhabditis remanei]KAF1746653.1 hypothetical protein GCK72_023110 [Caenorhabditis remanei]